MELRCDHILHGIMRNGVLEVKCRSRFCGAGKGVVVIHRFDPATGELLGTKKYKDTPTINKEGARHGLGHRAAVRTA